MSGLVIDKLKYITDEAGKRQEVVVPFKTWKSITEELELLREKQQILFGLQQACREAKMQEEGKLPEQALDDFLNEL
jgi:hypothetical protein